MAIIAAFIFCLTFYFRFYCHCYATLLPALRATSQRLGVVAAPTELPAGYKLPNLHCRFCGVTAAITPNRTLEAVLFCFLIFFKSHFQFSIIVLHTFVALVVKEQAKR